MCGNGVAGRRQRAFQAGETAVSTVSPDSIWGIVQSGSRTPSLANLVCLPVHLRGIRACLVYCAERLTQENNSRMSTVSSHVFRDCHVLSRAFWWEQRQNAARMSVIARLGLVPSARRTVNLTSRFNSGPSLATPAFRANRSRKLVRAFASNNENCCDTPSMQNVPGTCSRPRDDPDGSCHQSTQSQRN